MRPEDIQVLRQLVEARSGVQVDPGKLYLIESRLAPVARREGFASIPEMIQAVRVHRDDRLMWAATDAMSVTETAFFRDRAVFELFRDEMLPALAQSRAGAPIRVWSAACSTGQEAYSLAMMVDEVRPRLPGARVDLFGSDLSERCLEKAQSGLYTQFEVQRGLPMTHLVKYFRKDGLNWRLNDTIRSMVTFREWNLLADPRPLGEFDIVFCRNVLIYFDRPTKTRVLDMVARQMASDGLLYLGGAETVLGISDKFEILPDNRGVYEKTRSGTARPALASIGARV